VIRRLANLLLLSLSVLGCDDLWRHYAGGVSGETFAVDGQRVLLSNGYDQGLVTWVVVVNWPQDGSTRQERLSDARFHLDESNEHVVRDATGVMTPPTDGWAYVFDGDELTSFRIEMTGDDLMYLAPAELTRYSDIEAYLRRFEITNERTQA